MSSLTLGQKKAIMIVVSIVLVICSYFLIFQKNMSSASEMEEETKKLNLEIMRLSNLQIEVNNMRGDARAQQETTSTFSYSFPCDIPQESAIYNIYRMMVKSGIEVTSIAPGVEQNFLVGGKFIPFDGREGVATNTADNTANAGGANTELSEVEKNPETMVSLHEMVGKTTAYEIQLTGTLKQIFKAVDWVAENDNPMSITNLSFSYDSSNGKLSGTMKVFFHALNGNGMTYEDPVDVEDFAMGTDKLFGVLKEK